MQPIVIGIIIGASIVGVPVVFVWLARKGAFTQVLEGEEQPDASSWLRQCRKGLIDWHSASQMASEESETALFDAGLALFDRIMLLQAQGREKEARAVADKFLFACHRDKRSILAELLTACYGRLPAKSELPREEKELLAIAATALLGTDGAFVKDAEVATVFPAFQEAIAVLLRPLPDAHAGRAVLAQIEPLLKKPRRAVALPRAAAAL